MADGETWGGPGIPGLSDFEVIGRGGFAVVYRAWQEGLGRHVAVKVLLADLSDESDARRFQRECAVLGKLGQHRHVVDVYDAGVTRDRRPYITMRYYSRGTLADQVQATGPIPAAEAVSMLYDLAEAVQAGHDLGVVHRDIKPDNVLIDDEGSVLLADFGVAAWVDDTHTRTSSGAFSTAYAAPEVLDENRYSVASDVYALGATGYALVSGREPFHSTTGIRQMMAIANDPPEPITAPGVPERLKALLLKAMAKDPDERPGSAREFAKSLIAGLVHTHEVPGPHEEVMGAGSTTPSTAESEDLFGESEPTTVRPASPNSNPWWGPQDVSTVLGRPGLSQRDDLRAAAQASSNHAQSLRSSKRRKPLHARTRLLLALLGLALAVGGIATFLANRPEQHPPDIQATVGGFDYPWEAAFGRDGQSAYIAEKDSNTVSVVDLASESRTAAIAVGREPRGLALTPDGARLLVANSGGGSLSVIETQTNTVIGFIDIGLNSHPTSVVMPSTGSTAYVTNRTTSGRGAVTVIDVASLQVTATIPIDAGMERVVPAALGGLTVTPDGGTVYVIDRLGDRLVAIDTSRQVVTHTFRVGDGAGSTDVEVSSDGQILFVLNENWSNVLCLTKSFQRLYEIPVGPAPMGMDLTRPFDADTLYVANSGGNSVTQIAAERENPFYTTAEAGPAPTSVVAHNASGTLIVTNSAQGTITFVRQSI